ncbi:MULTISPECIES: Glu/Leu/Phe/Val dehydrogenase [Streptomyces]|uniref:Glu/Leu/Phe/Val dehydrogenase n=1 Tax=Streptomyces lycii TaxID=2654337 RepID=A0ABQ7FMB9_9ACTN|nr:MULTISPECIES: Glu/Leu/Phe/Val dehydrogenase dimerization domain-containing protein [Streptomyces]KAF4409550.1 Glu/Leu/Phe/Val dehydrogenase [Streptomyces lycii]PGH48090.1 glutamate dehydrogenase [Streptomyces sp. Ru87]
MTGTLLQSRPAEESAADPLLATVVTSPPDGLHSWVVVDSLADGMAMGGTRMTESVTEDEVKNLARAMTTKLALAGLPIGGAKAGIRAVPGRRDETLRAFGRSVAPLLHGGVYLGCDLGTTHADRDVFFAEAGYDVLRDTRIPRLPTDWADFWKPLVDITGYGVSVGTLAAVDSRSDTGSCRVAVQGFGTVGRAVAKTLENHGHRIVAVADVEGTVHDPRGLPVADLLAATNSAGTIDRGRLPDSVTVHGEPEAWLDVDADVLVLAAAGDAVRADNVDRIRARIVVEGGNLCCTAEAKKAMAARGVALVPDVVANVGGAAVTGCVLTGTVPYDLPHKEMVNWLFDWVGDRVRRNSEDVLEIAAAGSADPVSDLLAHRAKAR